MKKLFLVLILLLCASPVLAQTSGAEPIARPLCAPYKNPALRTVAEAMCERHLLDAFALLVNQTFKLPKNLPIVGAECGQSNAFYDRNKVAIVICYELGKEVFDRVTRELRTDADAQGHIAAGALFFLFAHELGHAVINLYDLPVLGREEDAADQIATFLLIVMASHKPEVARYWTIGAHWFFSKRPLFFARGHFADEHSVNPQRQFNIACWIYGSDPNRYVQLAQYAKLPNSRAQRCPGEYQQMLSAAKQMLSPYIKH
jgi:hypothetical protein